MEGTNSVLKTLCLTYVVLFCWQPCQAQEAESSCPGGADVTFVLDKSGSVGLRFSFVIDFVTQIVTRMGAGDTTKFGLVTYSDRTNVNREFDLTTFTTTDEVLARVGGLSTTTGGETHTGLALATARTMFTELPDRDAYPNIAIVVTDGKSTNGTETQIEAGNLKSDGVKIISIGIGLNNDEALDELTMMASHPNYTYNVGSFQVLTGILGSLCREIAVIVRPCENEHACSNNGLCSETGDGGHTCSCFRGWSGTVCEDDIDECEFLTCNNKGHCTQGNATYTCTCDAGWTGPDCEADIDYCRTGLCQNGGTCIEGNSDYICACVSGWTGANCETDIDYCRTGLCQNGGTCIEGNSDYTCACASGWTGANCETDIDYCRTGLCQNGGTCIEGNSDYTCACASGWTGANCETDIDYCRSGLCQNGGTCIERDSSYTCFCASGWTGTNCETNTDECREQTCNNNGVCHDGYNAYTCDCYQGYDGQDCQDDIDDCEYITCNNHGQCIDGNNTYSCNCDQGFEGQDCETNVNDCAGVTCSGRGNCIDGVNNYTCDCITPFTGRTCQESTGYNCGSNSPCGKTFNGRLPIIPYKFYYPAASSERKFIQCDAHGACFERVCGLRTKWNQAVLTCVHDPDYSNVCSCTHARGYCPSSSSSQCQCIVPWTGANCDVLTNYDCGSNNPCNPRASQNTLYYPGTQNNRYVQCSDTSTACQQRTCPDGTIWSQAAVTCIDDPNSDTCNIFSTNTECESEVQYQCNSNSPCGSDGPIVPHIFYYPSLVNNKFIQCSEWGQCHLMSCAAGTVWDQSKLTCDHDTNANGACQCTAAGQKSPHPDLDKYFECDAGLTCVVRSCAYPLVYDHALGLCNWA